MITSDTDILRFVTAYADRSHGAQLRKYTGERYIVHPLRVMEIVREFQGDTEVLSAALLHDVLEDTPVTALVMERELQPVLGDRTQRTVQLVVELTDVFVKSSYPRMNRRSRKEKEVGRLSLISPDAQTIKYADIIDNVTDIVKQDTDFARVYVREARQMVEAMADGNQDLRRRALSIVGQCLSALSNEVVT